MTHFEFDVQGEVCPIPMLKVKNKLEEMHDGDELSIHANFTRAVRNMLRYAKQRNYPIEVHMKRSGEWIVKVIKSESPLGDSLNFIYP